MALARMRIPEDRLKQLLSEATDSAVYNLIGIAHADIPGFRRRLGVPNSWTRAAKGWLAAVGRVVLRRWRDWEEGIYPEPIDQEELKALVERELNGAPPDPREVPGRPALTPQQLLVEIRRWFNSPEGHGHWPTIAKLAGYVGHPVETVQDRVNILLDRRLAARDEDRVMPYEAKAGPMVTYTLSQEEIAARYGPPSRKEQAPRPIGLFPENNNQPHEQQEVQEEMPTGKRINWPPDEEFLELVAATKQKHGDLWAVVIAGKFGSVHTYVKKRFYDIQARQNQATSQTTEPETVNPQITPHAANIAAALAPEEAGQGLGTPDPDPASDGPTDAPEGIPVEEDIQPPLDIIDDQTAAGSGLTDENIEKLGRIAQILADHGMPLTLESVEVHGNVRDIMDAENIPGLKSRYGDSSDPRQAEEWPQDAEREASRLTTQEAEPGDFQDAVDRIKRGIVEEATLATHATLILIDESADRPAQVRVVHEHLTEAPEQFGDQWGEAIRVQGRRTIRIWTCVGRLEVQGAPLCVMLPLGVGLHQVESRERGVA